MSTANLTKFLKLLLVIVLLKSIVWSLLIPLWHFPDEQAHFGHVAFNVEIQRYQRQGKNDLTEEIAISEKLLGTFRDEHGNNRFTYHPEYNLDYTQTLTGIYENEIKSLPSGMRGNFVAQESAYYPELFYNLSGFIYKTFYQANLFIRVFTIRLAWLPLLLIIIWSGFKITRVIFPKDKHLSLLVALMVGFHPMLSFVSSGISSDNLYNALFSLMILASTLLIIRGFSLPLVLGLGVITGLGMNTKPQFLISLAIILPALIISIFKKINRKNYWKIVLGILLFLGLSFVFGGRTRIKIFLNSWNTGKLFSFFRLKNKILLPDYSLIDHVIWTIKHTIREVAPWYWGVFRWLSLVLPRWVNRVLNRLVLIAVVGVIIKLLRVIKDKKLKNNQGFIFLIYTVFIYFTALTVWDWSFFRTNNFSFGIQGRYYFPVIIPQMILLSLGIKEIFGLFGKIAAKLSLIILSLWFIILNFIALYTVASSYYNIANLKIFIIQASQYKPFFAKGNWLIGVLMLYLIASLIFIWKLSRIVLKQIKNEK